MKHPTSFELSAREVANRVSKFRYDALRDFLYELGAELDIDSENYAMAHKELLSQELAMAAANIWKARTNINEARKICELETEEK